jgi:hypothetical protein
MKLYLISQGVNNGYDTYDSAVVAAENEQAAKETYPAITEFIYSYHDSAWWWIWPPNSMIEKKESGDSWANNSSEVNVVYIGEADKEIEAGVICASFNAG